MDDQDRAAWDDARREAGNSDAVREAKTVGAMATWSAVALGVALVTVLYAWPGRQEQEPNGYVKASAVVEE